MEETLFNQLRDQVMPEGDLGMESLSTVGIFGYETLLKNIRMVKSNMRIVCNAGTVMVNHMGALLHLDTIDTVVHILYWDKFIY